MLSKSCTYGIQASVFVAAAAQEGFVPIREISGSLGISHHFLTKVLQGLTRRGIMRSFRGPNGGVALAQPAERLTLKQLVLAIDGPELFECCVLGLPNCGTDRPCPLHDDWGRVRGGIDDTLSETTVAELAVRFRQGGTPLLDLNAFFIDRNKTKESQKRNGA